MLSHYLVMSHNSDVVEGRWLIEINPNTIVLNAINSLLETHYWRLWNTLVKPISLQQHDWGTIRIQRRLSFWLRIKSGSQHLWPTFYLSPFSIDPQFNWIVLPVRITLIPLIFTEITLDYLLRLWILHSPQNVAIGITWSN